MKTVKQVIDTLISMPEAEREQEMVRWVKEAAATLSAKEYDELLSDFEARAVVGLLLSKRMRARGAQPEQTAREVLTKEDWDAAALVDRLARLQEPPDSKH